MLNLLPTLSPGAIALREQYYFRLKPAFFQALLVLSVLIIARNLVVGNTNTPGLFLLAGFSLLALGVVRFAPTRFSLLDHIIALPILVASVWQHLMVWPLTESSPVLVFFSLQVVMLATIGHVAWATVALLIGLSLALATAFSVPRLEGPILLQIVAETVAPIVLYMLAVVLHSREMRLFNRRVEVLEALQGSINLRTNLLQTCWQSLQPPVERLRRALDTMPMDWTQVTVLSESISDELAAASRKTMELESGLHTPPTSLPAEMESLSRGIMKTLLNTAAAITSLIMLSFLLGGAEISISLIGSFIFALVLFLSADHVAANANLRRHSIYGFLIFMVWGCITQWQTNSPLYDVIYGLIFVFCAFNATSLFDALVMTLVCYLLLALWFLQTPTPSLAVETLRGNVALSLTFMVVISTVRLRNFRGFLAEVGEQEQQLMQERVLRHRLMATLFHDIANPLQVILGQAWLANEVKSATPAPSTLARLAQRILTLLEVTRLLGESDDANRQLPVDAVALDDILLELQETFRDRLQAKQLSLTLEPSHARVLVHPTILSLSVLANLMVNAIKFSPSFGRIAITTTRGVGIRQGMLGIHLTDQGGGIPADVIAQLNSDNAMPSSTGSAGETGFGQGLQLAKMYLAMMGGALEFGGSATVTVYVRLATAGFRNNKTGEPD